MPCIEKIFSTFSKKFSTTLPKPHLPFGIVVKGEKTDLSVHERRWIALELTLSQQKIVRHQFDSFCKKILREEARDYERHIAWRSGHEELYAELPQEQECQLYALDEYPSEKTYFHVQEYDIAICNDKLADALAVLSAEKRDIVLLSYFLDMTDKEIADKLDMVRHSVQYKRARSLKELKKEMEDV